MTTTLVGDSVKENGTVENIERLFRAAKARGHSVFVSPHYLYPHDQAWRFGGAVEMMMLEGKEFFRTDPLSLDKFAGSGADWLGGTPPARPRRCGWPRAPARAAGGGPSGHRPARTPGLG